MRNKRTRRLALLFALGSGIPLALPNNAVADAAGCAALASAGLFPDTTVTLTEFLAASGSLPARCRVVATIKPTPGSNIGVEYRLPEPPAWNGKFLGIGGGGFGGSISSTGFDTPNQRGYAAAQTDIGHKVTDGEGWALTAPGVPNADRVTDYAWRSWERMTVVGKLVVTRYYARGPRLSYWQGCSTGGRQGLVMAQRFPDYYDAIIAGAPVYTSRLQLRGVANNNNFFREPGRSITPEHRTTINNAVLAACDRKDGVTDGYLTDPRQCNFDPKRLQCRGTPSASCLTREQVDSVRKYYEGPETDRGYDIYFGVNPGGELNWDVTDNPGISGQMARYMVFLDPAYDIRTLDINDRDTIRKWDSAPVSVEGNAGDPDIRAFLKRGGKLLLWHGFNDNGPSSLSTIDYYQRVEREIEGDHHFGRHGRPDVSDSVRLFLAPGTYHCGGGPGPNSFDMLTALEQWRERGAKPEKILASNATSGITRPLCPYPEVARYKGHGDPKFAENYRCVRGRK